MSDEQQPNGHLDARLDNLLSGLDGVHASIDAERQARVDDAEARRLENVSRDRKTFWTSIAAGIAAFVGVIGILVGGIGITRASKADEKAVAAQVETQALLVARTAAQKVTCDQANNQAGLHNSLADAFDQVLVLAVAPNPDRPRTEAEQAATDVFYASAHALVDGARDPGRDCTPEGIKAYYSN